MPSEKIDTQFSLALELSEAERGSELETGFDPIAQTWEIIIKYSGDLSSILANVPGVVSSAQLSGGFAVLVVRETAISFLSQQKEVIYIDKPKNLFFGLENGIPSACIPSLWRSPLNLSGRGTIACIIDSGIEYTHADFRTPDGKTRILALWDQTIPANTVLKWDMDSFLTSPEGYFPGTLFPKEQIDAALAAGNPIDRQRICPTFDNSGHGTHVNSQKHKLLEIPMYNYLLPSCFFIFFCNFNIIYKIINYFICKIRIICILSYYLTHAFLQSLFFF